MALSTRSKNKKGAKNTDPTPPQPTTTGLLSADHKRFLPKIHLHDVKTAGRHPHWRYGRAYYFIFDHKITHAIRLEMKKWERQLKVPPCDDVETLIAEGLTLLDWGDALFIRISTDPVNDLLAICVAPEKLITPEIPRFNQAIDLVIGPKDECGPNRPERVRFRDDSGKLKSEWRGGTVFERATARNGANKQGPRCYANAITAETGLDIIAPAANLSGDWDDALERRRSINIYMSEAHANILEKVVPKPHLKLLQKRHSVFNSPTYGASNNLYFSGLQINIASPTHGNPATLKDQLGAAGDGHADLNDDPLSFTAMTAGMQLREGVHPGLFHVLSLGVFIVTRLHTTSFFCATHFHGGTAPCVPFTMPLVPYDLRVTFISYPTLKILEHTGDLAMFSALYGSNIENVISSPGLLYNGDPNLTIPSSTRATFGRNGRACMADDTLERFVLRVQYSDLLWQWKQLKRTSTLSYEDFSGLTTWKLGPGGDKERREEVLYQIGIFRLKLSATMPTLLNRQITDCFIEGVPRIFSKSISQLPWLLSSIEFSQAEQAQLKVISETTDDKKRVINPQITNGESESESESEDDGSPSEPKEPSEPKKPKKPAAGKGKGPGPTAKEKAARQQVAEAQRRADAAAKRAQNADVSDDDGGIDFDAIDPASDDGLSDPEEPTTQVPDSIPLPSSQPHVFTAVSPVQLAITYNTAKKEYLSIRSADRAKGPARGRKLENDTELVKGALRVFSENAEPEFAAAEAARIAKQWETIRTATSNINNLQFYTRRANQLLMLNVCALWMWWTSLSSIIDKIYESDKSDVPEWLYKLFVGVKDWAQYQRASRKWDRRAFIGGLTSKEATTAAPAYEVALDIELLKHFIKIILKAIVMEWFDFPKLTQRPASRNGYQNWDVQGRFIHILLTICGTRDILLFDGVYQCFCSPRTMVLSIENGRDPTDEDWQPLISYLTGLFPAQPHGPDRVARAAVYRYGRLCKLAAPSPDQDDPEPASVGPSTSERDELEAIARVVLFLISTLPLFDEVTSPGSYKVSSETPQTEFIRGKHFEKSTHQVLLTRHIDQHNPWREQAPTRAHVKSHLSPTDLRTRWGLFSLLINRIVSYGTSLAFDYPVFEDLNDFLEVVKELEESIGPKDRDLFICTIHAYGKTPSAGRSSDLAPAIWTATATWEKEVAKHPDGAIPWDDTAQWLQHVKMPHMGKVGNLTGYLFLADLACSGVVQEPTAEEVGYYVAKMDKGAWTALDELGLTLPRNHATEVSILEDMAAGAFEQLYDDLRAVLGEQTATKLEFSPILLEHVLCKYQRLSRKGLCNFSDQSLEAMMDTVDRVRKKQAVVEDDAMDCDE